jgi:1-acyl-sn-glycerol-3-phosphate acyltransferase
VTFYQFARAIVLSVCKVFFRVRVVGLENVPASGPYIVAPSHRSNLDVPFAAFVTRRTIRFLAKDELFTPGFGEKLFNALGAIPVDRGTADRGALRKIEAALREGSVVGLFPEGTRKSGPDIADLFDGTTYLAVKLGVPIVPVGIGGSEYILAKGRKIPRVHRVVVSVGKPIVAPALEGRARRATASRLTAELHTELQRVFDDAERLAH